MTLKYIHTKLVAAVILLALAPAVPAQPLRKSGPVRELTEEQKIVHVLNRLAFGPGPGDVEKVERMGLEAYIESQLDPQSVDDKALSARLSGFDVIGMNTSDIFAKYPNPGALLQMLEGGRRAAGRTRPAEGDGSDPEAERRQRRQTLAKIYQENGLRPANRIMFEVESARILRAAYSERQLQEVMVDFWANHFNVFSGKAATRWYVPSYERDVIRKHALGNFRDLVLGTAKHPAMLFYLDNFQSVAEGTGRTGQRLQRAMRNGRLAPRVRERLRARGLSDEQIDQRLQAANQGNRRGINENYARELMELHTLGVDGGYTQQDIREVARAFTGWTIFDARGARRAAGAVGGTQDQRIVRQARQFGIDPDTDSGSFIFAPRLHDAGVKTVLGQKVNEGGIGDGEKVIDILVKHPSTAKHIARKLAVKFVSDTPGDDLVETAAAAFQKSNGDIKMTLRALFSHKDFFSPKNHRAKIKTPFELVVSSLRALGAETRGSRQLNALLQRMGEPLYGYQAPTGYPDKAADWVNTGALLERMNFAVAIASGVVPGVRVDLSRFGADKGDSVLEHAVKDLLSGEVSPETMAILRKKMDEPLPKVSLGDGDPGQAMMLPGNNRRPGIEARAARRLEPRGDPEVFKAVGLILGSPEFQRQ